MSKRMSLVAATLAGVFGPWSVSVAVPCIDIEKQISIDGGETYFDADNVGEADVPMAPFPSNARYRFILSNCGDVALDEVDVTDERLGILAEPVAQLPVDGEFTIDAADPELGSKLDVANRCDSAGEFMNTVTAVGSSQGEPTVTDSDTAVLVCGAGDPGVRLSKQVSIDGGQNYVDADEVDGADVPEVAPPGSVIYRFVVSNVGVGDLASATVSDPALGITDFSVGAVAEGQSVTVESDKLPALAANRCETGGPVINTATVVAQASSGGDAVMDMDSAVVNCIGELRVTIEKQISVDGGVAWADADNEGDADVPIVSAPSPALYRYIITNVGDLPFDEADVTDLELGIVGAPAHPLAPGEEMILTSDKIPALEVDPRCEMAGTFINEVTVTASLGQGQIAMASDTAVLVCVDQPRLRIKKQISTDGGVSYADADDPADADVPVVTAPAGALYRFIVENVGMADLQDVTVSDPMLGIDGFAVGDLAQGDSVTLTSTQLPALDVAERCDTPGVFTNDAEASGSTAGGARTTASDVAVLVCEAPPPEDCTIAVDKTCLVNPKQGDECTVADHFDKKSYGNNDGSKRWSADWMEHDPFDKGPWSGQVAIEYGRLTLEDYPDTGTEPSAAREVDLSHATHASLSFDFATTRGVDKDDAVVVEVSGDGGASYTVLKEITHIHGAVVGWEEFDISEFVSANTRIRFRVSSKYGYQDEVFLVDNVKIRFDGCGPKPADACTLDRGKSDEVEYGYLVTNTGNVDIRNISVDDDVLGTIAGSPIDSLAPQESVSLSQRAWVGHTVTNTVTVRGHTDTSSCEATDSVTVTVGDKPDDSDSDSDSGKDSDSDSGKDSDSDSGKDSDSDSGKDSDKDSDDDSGKDSDSDSGKDSDKDSDSDSGKDSDSD